MIKNLRIIINHAIYINIHIKSIPIKYIKISMHINMRKKRRASYMPNKFLSHNYIYIDTFQMLNIKYLLYMK